MNRMHSRWLMAAAAALFVVGCAQSNGDISYVQPNYTKKSDLLDGVWYVRNTVTKTPATTGFTFTGETGDLEKVVWEIQEGHLIGYRAYPQLPGQDQNIEQTSVPSGTTTRHCEKGVCVGGHKYYGNPVVVYPIEKHFDIQRGYNPASGETTNVINENSSDRPWNEREYIRVAWANQALGKSFGTFGIINPNGKSDFSSLIYANEPGTDPYDWPRQEFVEVNGARKMNYFEFTGRYMASATAVTGQMSDGTKVSVPRCWLRPEWSGHAYDCTAQQIEMRTSIAKVDPNRTLDYEPLVYDNAMMNKFGYFRTERINYDRRFGINESDVIYLANRHRIWKNSFQKDGQGNVDWKSPIPMAQREVSPIVYYLPPANRMGGIEHYNQYLEGARILETNWDRAFRRAVAAAKGLADWQQAPRVFFVCENPVPAGAPEACGPEGFEARFGDLRRSFLWTIPEAVPNGLLGYGPSSADPETGEIISANANQYTAAVERSAQHTLDMVNVLTGDMTVDQLIRGEDVRNYMLENPTYAAVQGKVGEVKSELQGDFQKGTTPTTGEFLKLTPSAQGILGKVKSSGGLGQITGDRLLAAAEKLRQHPQLESALLDNPEMATDMVTMMPSDIRAAAQTNPDVAREYLRKALLRAPELLQAYKARQEFASRRNIYLADFFEDRYIMSMAFREAQNRQARVTALIAEGLTPADARARADDELRWKFRKHIWRATAEHEVGHTLGLRHNFQGSFDAMNFHDPYWDLKKPTLTVTQGTEKVVPRTPADLKAASDGLEEQLYGGLHDHEYSSIMDYGGKSNADWQGVGKYDEAAIIFAYSGDTQPGYVEVFANQLRTTTEQFQTSEVINNARTTLAVTGAGYDLPVITAQHTTPAVPNYTERFHYSTVPLRFGSGSTIDQVIDSGIENMRARKLEKWSVVQEKQAQLRSLLRNNPVPAQQDVVSMNVPLEVPYMFCTDDHVGYVLSCNRWDRGADYYEMTRTWLEDYWNGYFFSHFRRDRYVFSTNNAFYGSFITFDNASMVYKHWVHALYGNASAGQQKVPDYVGGPFGYDPLVQAYWSMASLDGINNLLQVMSVPPTGLYMRYQPSDGGGEKRWDVINQGYDFDQLSEHGRKEYEDYYARAYGADAFAWLPRGRARHMYSRYDYKSGFGFWDRLTEVGHYNDQIGALFAAVMPQASFLGVDDYADQDRYYIPYYLMFRNELNDVFGSFWATGSSGLKSFGEGVVRPTLYLSAPNGADYTKPNLVFPLHVKGSSYIQGFDYPKAPELPADPKAMTAPANIQTTWTSRIYALYLGMALFNVNFDLDYAKQNMVIKLGGNEQVTVPTGYEAFELVDTEYSGARYVAYQPAGATKDSPAVVMVQLAKEYQSIVRDPTLVLNDPADHNNPLVIEQTRTEYLQYYQDKVRDLDLMRGMYQVYGKAF